MLVYFVASIAKGLISIQSEHKDIGIHIKYRNKKWVTNSKGAPKH